MNLATRCTACGTMFRVVQDQLKVSEGWVRCGRCQAVFNAQESLFDLEHDTPPPWQAPADMPGPDPASEGTDNDIAATASFAADPADEAPFPEAQPAEPQAWEQIEPPMPMSAAESEQHPADAPNATGTDGWQVREDSAPSDALTTDTALVAAGADDAAPVDTEAAADADVVRPPTAEEHVAPEVTPSFLQQAQRSERWQQPPVRRMLWAAVAVSGLLLGAQVTHHFRQVIAAQHPGALPWLQGFCAVARCQIDTLQRIADVSIESTALTQAQGPAPAPTPAPAPASAPASATAPESASAPASAPASSEAPEVTAAVPDSSAHVLRLALTLRNRGEWAIAMPSVDLSLTGSDGELVARRSLSPRDFGAADPRLLPGQDTPLSLRFRVAGGRVSGYTVEVFYP